MRKMFLSEIKGLLCIFAFCSRMFLKSSLQILAEMGTKKEHNRL